jgi:ABC-2 type transport system permease protein
MEKLLLKIFRALLPLFRSSEIDREKLMIIVETKLMMDNRRVNMSWRSSQQKENANHLQRVLILYTIFGALMGAMLFVIDQFFTIMVIMHSYVLFMMAMTLITDFSSVLLDTTDNQIILPKPVNGKTVFMARMVHVFIYLFQFTLAISAGVWVAAFIKYGVLTGLAVILTTFMAVLLAVFVTYFLYLAMLRFSSEQRIKEIITWFQIFMTVIFTIGYQLFPRLINYTNLNEDVTLHWYSYLLPPVWMSLAVEAVNKSQFDAIHLLMIFLTFAVPLLSFWMLNKYLAPGFTKKLAALQNNNNATPVNIGTKESRKSYVQMLASLFARSPYENASFLLTWQITSRDRNFKMQFYPAIAYVGVMFFVFVLRGGSSVEENWERLPATANYLWLVYMPLFLTSSAFTLISFNEHYNASWIYHSAPVTSPGSLITGAMKALLVKFFFPVFFLLMGLALWIWGAPVIDDFLFGFINNIFILFVLASLSQHFLPFSMQPNTKQQAGKVAKALLQFLVIGILVGSHYLLIQKPVLLLAAAPILMVSIFFMYRFIFNIAWTKISI